MISALHLLYLVVLVSLLTWTTVPAQQCPDTIPEDVLLLAQFLPADASTPYPEAKVPDLLSKLPQEVQRSIQASQSETAITLSEVFGQADYFHDVCPTYRYVLPHKLWYFNYNNKQLKCFSLQPIYITWCKTRYCSLSDKSLSYWWYRCVPEWRDQYFWAACTDQNGVSSARYVKWRLPASCNCKHYKKYGSNMCQEKTQDKTQPDLPYTTLEDRR